jgi:ABC-2 type transport system ATP-binding protein
MPAESWYNGGARANSADGRYRLMIETHNLTKRFPCSIASARQPGTPAGVAGDAAGDRSVGWLTAVDGVTLDVPTGQILALLGPNGAGKTTTVRMLAAILRPTDGWARVAGLDTVREASQVRQAVGLLTEFPGLYLRMRAAEYLGFFGQLQGLAEAQIRQRIETLMERFGLAEQRQQRLAEYSKGMRQKLALIRAMLHDPPLLLLDEPTSAMDPHSAKLVHDAILNLRDERRTIVICTHNLSEAELLADRIAIISHGQIVALDTPAQLKSQMLGSPLMELRLAHPLDGPVREALSAQPGIEVEAWGDTWFRYRTPSPGTINPELVARLAGLGAQVVTLSELPRSLQEVYLRIVGDP